MTCQEKLNELLAVYQKISLLSNKNGCQVLRLQHKTLSKDLVLHILPNNNSAYQTLCDVRHKNLPQIYDCFILEDGMIALEEYIEGLTIAQICEMNKYTPRGAKKVIKQICAALDVLHQFGIVHRDIKPENVIIDNNGRVVLIDFNVTRKMSSKSRDTQVLGTIGYAPPEQMGISQSDNRSDIYSVGVLLNVMLTGVHPSEQIADGRLGKVIKKCTAINPNDRYQTALDLAKNL